MDDFNILFCADGPKSVEIAGKDVLTIGILYNFVCYADCYPTCTYTWNVNGKILQGEVIEFTFPGPSGPEVLNCVAKNPASGKTATVNKTVQASGTVLWCLMDTFIRLCLFLGIFVVYLCFAEVFTQSDVQYRHTLT